VEVVSGAEMVVGEGEVRPVLDGGRGEIGLAIGRAERFLCAESAVSLVRACGVVLDGQDDRRALVWFSRDHGGLVLEGRGR
jgi:hypothetical protein